ncbi:DUF1433 domain-containing protein [Staphylococcus pettenkoferi]|uniref:DUF1433 domain-containing protein n=2 Tax=Staphylococcus pettenkoferi TaxID=170573 RepID=A0A9Q4D8E1_9STAP|nr:DUF1433 domain-containing protein [Staphylococcus pettenkoferi]MCY1568776.1 DUF1433 domain-containing protein [Staphylococcus pettenkoferi]MCY1577116.1 DUF1433 domain-containing protein [Staphylococcus pettenkoferi]MCY1595535.1 DUF1433 domain-containing protein [Staphylococcus pettenkoferi]MCY1617548.1 DUF1433 domain-containing protein [Staphylococcus pettenkoferi]
MSKRKLFLYISLVVIVALLITGYVMHKHKKDKYIETQKVRIDLYFKHNLKKYKSLQITKVDKSPMGGYFIYGHINNDKRYYFNAHISPVGSHQYNGDLSYNPKTLGKLLIHSEAKDELNPNEIIKREHLNKENYEADPPIFWGFESLKELTK